MSLYERLSGKLGVKAVDREFEILYVLYHHDSLARDEIPHHIHYPECLWIDTTLDDLERMNLISSNRIGWVYEITEKGAVLLSSELCNLRIGYVYKAYLITTTDCGISLTDAAESFHDLQESGILDDFDK